MSKKNSASLVPELRRRAIGYGARASELSERLNFVEKNFWQIDAKRHDAEIRCRVLEQRLSFLEGRAQSISSIVWSIISCGSLLQDKRPFAVLDTINRAPVSAKAIPVDEIISPVEIEGWYKFNRKGVNVSVEISMAGKIFVCELYKRDDVAFCFGLDPSHEWGYRSRITHVTPGSLILNLKNENKAFYSIELLRFV